MNGSASRLVGYLHDIIAAIERIERYTERIDEQRFISDSLIQDGVIRNLEIIGEASHRIRKQYPDFAAQNSHLPLAAAYEMRNALAHGYFKVDLAIVWRPSITICRG